MKNYLFYLICHLFIFNQSSAQNKFQKTFGGTGFDAGVDVKVTNDGGYAITGFFENSGANGADVFLIKTDQNGDTLWTRTYGGPGDDGGRSVQQTNDGGYIICGFAASFGDHIYLIKTDPNGDTLWTKLYSSQGAQEGDLVIQTSDGGYLISGRTDAGFNNSIIIKTDSSGDTLWTRSYEGITFIIRTYSILETNDGGYILAGYAEGSATNINDMFLVKTNQQGDTLWTKTYGGTFDEQGRCVRQTTDGGYIVAGSTYGNGFGLEDIYAVRTDNTGNVIWSKRYGGPADDYGYYVVLADDGGFYIAGQTESFTANNQDGYLIQVDSSGNLLWSKSYGGSDMDAFRSMQKTNDDGLIMTGFTLNSNTTLAAYLVKTNANGVSQCNELSQTSSSDTFTTIVGNAYNLVPYGVSVSSTSTIVGSGCPISTICSNVGVDEIANQNSLIIYPNPFTSDFTIKGTSKIGVIKIFDLTGKEILHQKMYIGETTVETESLVPGYYFVSCIEGNKIINNKLLKF